MLSKQEQQELLALEQELGGLTPNEAQELDVLEQEVSSPTFSERVDQTVSGAAKKAMELSVQKIKGDITGAEFGYRMLGEAAAPVVGAPMGAVIGESVDAVSAADKLMGGYGGKALGAAGEFISPAVAPIAKAAEYVSEEFPRTTGVAVSTFNLGALGVPFAKYGEDILKNSYRAIRNIKPKKLKMMTPDDLREEGGRLMELADRQGGGVTPKFWQEYTDDLQKNIERLKDETWLQKLASVEGGDNNSVIKALGALTENLDDPKNFRSVMRADQILGELAESSLTQQGKYTAAGRDYLIMQHALRDKLAKSGPDVFLGKGKEAFDTLQKGRKIWGAQYRMQDIQNILDKSVGAQQPNTVIKNGFRRLRDNPKKMKNFSPDEQLFIRKAAETGFTEGTLKLAGSGLTPLLTGAAGSAGGAPFGFFGMGGGAAGGFAAGRVAQEGAKSVAEQIAREKGERALQSVVFGVQGQPVPVIAPYVGQAAVGTTKAILPMSAVEAYRQEEPLRDLRRRQ